jgi:CheY-like chemotaxis protein
MIHTVLYVEDSDVNVFLVEHILQERPDVQLLAAPTAGEGLRLAEAHQPAVILLDRRLPDMNGGQLLRQLKASSTTAAIPVVMISGDSGMDMVDEFLALGASDFLEKPFKIDQLLSIVDRFCQ